MQEALTNATKHAPGSNICLDIDWSNAEVTLTFTNSEATAVSGGLVNQGTGHGLIGMRERAAAAGGTVSAGPTGAGSYRVMATLPVLNAAATGAVESAAAIRDPHRSDNAVTS